MTKLISLLFRRWAWSMICWPCQWSLHRHYCALLFNNLLSYQRETVLQDAL